MTTVILAVLMHMALNLARVCVCVCVVFFLLLFILKIQPQLLSLVCNILFNHNLRTKMSPREDKSYQSNVVCFVTV